MLHKPLNLIEGSLRHRQSKLGSAEVGRPLAMPLPHRAMATGKIHTERPTLLQQFAGLYVALSGRNSRTNPMGEWNRGIACEALFEPQDSYQNYRFLWSVDLYGQQYIKFG